MTPSYAFFLEAHTFSCIFFSGKKTNKTAAKAEDGESIKQDKEVNILRFDGDYIIVESTSRLEDKYSGR